MSDLRSALVGVGLVLLLPALALGQGVAFGGSTVEVVSEWRGQDRGDGSGSYILVTTLTDPSSEVSIRHELSTERNVEGEVSSSEAFVVVERGEERYRAGSDLDALGPYADPTAGWVISFDAEFHPEPRANYRPQQKRIAAVIAAVAPDARVSAKRGSDGRTSATIEIPGEHPADVLARQFVGIREALREADLGLAKLVVKGKATAPGATVEAAAVGPEAERP